MITATIHNPGAAASAPTSVRFTDNGKPIGPDQTLPAIPVNGHARISATWMIKGLSGSHTLSVIVDPNNTLSEVTKTNNTASVTVTLVGGKVQ